MARRSAAGWLHLERYGRFSALSYLLLFAFMALLISLTLRRGALRCLGAGEPVALFFSSFAITYVAHLVGYLDIPLGILAMAMLLIRDAGVRFVAAIPVCIMALFIHEMFLLVFMPLVLFSFVVDGLAAQDARYRMRLWAMGGFLVCVGTGTTLKLALRPPMTTRQARLVGEELSAKANFSIRKDFFEVLGRSGGDNLREMKNDILHDRRWLFSFLLSVAIFMPTIVLLVVPVLWSVRAIKCPGIRRAAAGAALAAIFSPLLMCLLGWDIARWCAWVCFDTYMVMLLLLRLMPGEAIRYHAAYRNAVILVIALNMATGESLMDGKQAHPFPFSTSLMDLRRSLSQSGWVAPQE